jgi:hypothetical protein
MIRVTASEAVYGFASWLAKHPGSDSVIEELAKAWCEHNKLEEPRTTEYPKNIRQPDIPKPTEPKPIPPAPISQRALAIFMVAGQLEAGGQVIGSCCAVEAAKRAGELLAAAEAHVAKEVKP